MPQPKQFLCINFDFIIEKKTGNLKLLECGDGLFSAYPTYNFHNRWMQQKIFSQLLKEIGKAGRIYIIEEQKDHVPCFLPKSFLEQHRKNIKRFKNLSTFLQAARENPEKFPADKSVIVIDHKPSHAGISSLFDRFSQVLKKERINIPILSAQNLFSTITNKIMFAWFFEGEKAVTPFLPKTYVVNIKNFKKTLSEMMMSSCECFILKLSDSSDATGIVTVAKKDLPKVMAMMVANDLTQIEQLMLDEKEKVKLSELIKYTNNEEFQYDATPSFIAQEIIIPAGLQYKGQTYLVTGRMVLLLVYEPETDELQIKLIDAFWKFPEKAKQPNEPCCHSSLISDPGKYRARYDSKKEKFVIDTNDNLKFQLLIKKEKENIHAILTKNFSPSLKKLFQLSAQRWFETLNNEYQTDIMQGLHFKPLFTLDERFFKYLEQKKHPNLLLVLLLQLNTAIKAYTYTNNLQAIDSYLLDEIVKNSNHQYEPRLHIWDNITQATLAVANFLSNDAHLVSFFNKKSPELTKTLSVLNKKIGECLKQKYKHASPESSLQETFEEKLKDTAKQFSDLGHQAFDRKKYRIAETFFLEALHIYKQQNDKASQASCLSDLASCYRNTGKFNNAIDLTKQALDLNKETNVKTKKKKTKKQTEKKYIQKLEQCQKLSDVKTTLFAEGKKALKEKQYEKALEKLKETKKIYKTEIQNTKPLANCFFKLAACAKGLGSDKKALDYAQKASEIIKALPDLSEEKRDKAESNVKQFLQTL